MVKSENKMHENSDEMHEIRNEMHGIFSVFTGFIDKMHVLYDKMHIFSCKWLCIRNFCISLSCRCERNPKVTPKISPLHD